MLIYSLFDRKLKEYGSLVLQGNDAAVHRALMDAYPVAVQNNGPLGKYPEDFDLMCVGEFDPESGEIGARVPRLVFNCGELVPSLLKKEV